LLKRFISVPLDIGAGVAPNSKINEPLLACCAPRLSKYSSAIPQIHDDACSIRPVAFAHQSVLGA